MGMCDHDATVGPSGWSIPLHRTMHDCPVLDKLEAKSGLAMLHHCLEAD